MKYFPLSFIELEPMKFSVKHTVDVPPEKIQDLLASLMESDLKWFIRIHKKHISDEIMRKTPYEQEKLLRFYILPTLEDCQVIISVKNPSGGDPILVTFNPDTIGIGLQIMADKYPQDFEDFISEVESVDIADTFGQCIAYGRKAF
jgi:hypothetical protein